ncbi:hypothetical protein SAMN04488028_102147 [Reichenbachiella agariperforans]|uniref:Uncharacterized protein n=1 Tax=Reichenbachiella agariperforans TaxID=156994 RepID=A0A1M6N876_REIAG|nr:hypothetical protein SAMN04488028_102147 [Reichenbachiella agariperforans]
MEAIHYLASFFFYLAIVTIVVGLFYKPWVVLWWMDKQNRWMVLQHYGSLAILSFLIKFITE